MPAATPLPRGPSVLTLYSAADLLTAQGCPVCRYAAEASDRYLGWFALEGHAEPAMITALCASLGMCARHTRRLASQPGAATRLTAVYRYVMTAARDLLASREATVQPCPACKRDGTADRSALETLLDGLSDTDTRSRCRDLGGVCLPHLAAAFATGPRRAAAWLAGTLHDILAASPSGLGWLAGTDPDAEARAVLRRALPPGQAPVPGACTACLATARAERDSLARLLGQRCYPGPAADDTLALCSPHLADTALAAPGSAQLRPLLAWQASSLGAMTGRRLRSRRTRGCEVCQAARAAEDDALAGLVRAGTRALQYPSLPCVRHYLAFRTADKRASQSLAPVMSDAAGHLIGKLSESFEQSMWTHRHGAPIQHSASWQDAVAFLDGAVFPATGGAGEPGASGSPAR